MDIENLPQLDFGDVVKLVFPGGYALFGSFQRTYTPEKGDLLVQIRHAGDIQSFAVKFLQRVEVME